MHNIRQIELGKKPNEEDQRTSQKKQQQEEEEVDCPQTRICIWDGDEFDEFESDYLNQIYPYKINKKTMTTGSQFNFNFLSSSLHYWVELVQSKDQEEGKLGLKDLKFIQSVFKEDDSDNWIAFRRWGQQFNKKQQFHKHESVQKDFIVPQGQEIHIYTRGDDEFVVVRYFGDNKQFHEYKKRFQVLFLFYIDGVSFVNEQTDTWVYFVIYKKIKESQRRIFIGVLSEYVFRLSSVKERHRISQVFILPSYQKSGHGKQILDIVYGLSLKNQKCFEITTQVPSFEFQCLRDYKELQLILQIKIFDLNVLQKTKTKTEIENNRKILLKAQTVRTLKQKLKIPGHQIQRLTNILLYYKIMAQDQDMPLAHFEEELRQKIILNVSPFKTRRKLPHITLYGQKPEMKDFFIQKAKEDILRNTQEIKQRFTQALDGYRRVIAKLKKVHLLP